MISPTGLILTFNERENIARTLAALSWVERILIVDSYSTDDTLEIAKQAHSGLTIIQRQFDSFAGQCNFGLTQITTPWVLSIDADYVFTAELKDEIQRLNTIEEIAGYAARFHYCVFGRRLRNTIYPPRTILYRRELAHYEDEGHGHRVRVGGKVESLTSFIDHDDRKPLSRWIREQDRYTMVEARHLIQASPAHLTLQDKIRRQVYFAPLAMFFYLLFMRGLILDGWRGWYYVGQRVLAELLLSLRLLELKKASGNLANDTVPRSQ
jgi:glycosyltransferase involved in cell wall biosynthesis